MSEPHYTANELAGLPGLPGTPQRVNSTAKRESWPFRKRHARGGGREYPLSCLPTATRTHLARERASSHLSTSPAPALMAAAEAERQRLAARDEGLILFHRLPDWQQRPALAKLEIIKAAHSFVAASGLAKNHGQEIFTREYNLGRISIAPWVRAEVPQFHVSTLRSWIAEEYQLGSMGLVDFYGNRKGQSKIETYITGTDDQGAPIKPMARALLAVMVEHPHIKAKHANEYLRAKVPGAPLVSDKSVQRWMDAWQKEHPVEWAHIVNPDSAKGSYQPAFGRVADGITGPNQRWEIDATPADILLTDGRYKIMGIIDVGPRRKMFRVSKTERAADNLLLARRALLTWGVPRHGVFVTDNGKPYVSEHFQRVLSDLEISQHICKPFASEEKPFIERAFRALSHDLMELLPGFCGHSVADRKAIEARKSFARRLMTRGELIEISMSAAELQSFLDRWCSSDNQRTHAETGKSADQIVSEWPHPIHTITDERALDVLLAPAAKKGGWCTPTKRKGIEVDTIQYYHPHLPQWFGKKVKVFRTDDIGRIVVYGPNDADVLQFLFVAENPELCGTPRAEIAAIARHHHKAILKDAEALKRQARKELAGRSVGELIQEFREKQAAQNQGNITYFPRPTTAHETAALAAARDAAAALDLTAAPSRNVDPATVAARSRLAREMAQPKTVEIPTDDKGRYRLWKTLDTRLRADGTLSDAERRFYDGFRVTPAWRAFSDMERSFGRDIVSVAGLK